MSSKVHIIILYFMDWLRGVLYSLCVTTCSLLYRNINCFSDNLFLFPPTPFSSLSGFRQRRREALWQSSSPPETCPHLVESIPCEDPACYLWQVQQEERCIPTKGSCGPGAAAQNMTCVTAEGTLLHLHPMGIGCIKIKTLTHTMEIFLVVQFGLLSAKECF